MIRYDRSPHSVVACCTVCGWREVAVTQDGAWRVAKAHEVGMHPNQFQVRNAEAARRRRAEGSGCEGGGPSVESCP